MKNVFLVALFIVASLLGALAWRQNLKIDGLEERMARATDENESLKQRLIDADQRLADAEKRPVAAEATSASPQGSTAPAPTPQAELAASIRSAAAAVPIDNPAVQKAVATSVKSSLDQRYGGLFRRLKLSPADLDKLKDLMAERQLSTLDVIRAAQLQGVNSSSNSSELPTLMKKVQAEVDENVHRLIGDQRFQQYQDYNQNISTYTLLDQIERRLSYTTAPLQESQTESLLRLLRDGAPSAAGQNGSDRVGLSFYAQGFDGANPLVAATPRSISSDLITRAQDLLTPEQAEVLRQIQAEQQIQANLLETVHTSSGASSPGDVGVTPPRGPTAPPAPSR